MPVSTAATTDSPCAGTGAGDGLLGSTGGVSGAGGSAGGLGTGPGSGAGAGSPAAAAVVKPVYGPRLRSPSLVATRRAYTRVATGRPLSTAVTVTGLCFLSPATATGGVDAMENSDAPYSTHHVVVFEPGSSDPVTRALSCVTSEAASDPASSPSLPSARLVAGTKRMASSAAAQRRRFTYR